MAFEGLTEKLSATFKRLRGKGRLSESDVKEAHAGDPFGFVGGRRQL